MMPEWERVHDWVNIQCKNQSALFSGIDFELPNYPSGGRLTRMLGAISRWRNYSNQIKTVEDKTGANVDLVFFAWIDSELHASLPPVVQAMLFPYYWSGLYFHPYHLRQTKKFLYRCAVWRDLDGIFMSRRCIAVALHDLSIVSAFSNRIGKPVIHFPETADCTPPNTDHPVAKMIREKANQRLVVGIIGCEPHKGTLNLVRAVVKADSARYFFAFIGNLPLDLYSESECLELSEFFDKPPENIITHFEPLNEGADYNAVFTAFDIPYLVYDNFISSSNRLTKAAYFERLVIAQNNYCVGSDVKEFDLGEAVPPGNPDAVTAGLERLEKRIRESNYPHDLWVKYRSLNSHEKLTERFQSIIELLPVCKN